MNDFEERLPWRIAALAGLLVGAVSACAGVGLWSCLLRMAAAFALFGLLGSGLRTILQHGDYSAVAAAGKHRGVNFDKTTPKMTASDLPPPEDDAPPSETSRT